jgi:hypothetical protein
MKTQNTTKHTRGPWSVNGNAITAWHKDSHICFMEKVTDKSQIKLLETDANARLISCAPELLDLIKRMNYAFYADGSPKAMKAVMAETKALIAKAEGRE